MVLIPLETAASAKLPAAGARAELSPGIVAGKAQRLLKSYAIARTWILARCEYGSLDLV